MALLRDAALVAEETSQGRGNHAGSLLAMVDALLTAQNALTASVVSYRIAELRLQRDLGKLAVDEQGLWKEYDPAAEGPTP